MPDVSLDLAHTVTRGFTAGELTQLAHKVGGSELVCALPASTVPPSERAYEFAVRVVSRGIAAECLEEIVRQRPHLERQVAAVATTHGLPVADLINESTLIRKDLFHMGFDLIERIGTGATAEVWRARRSAMNDLCAVKILSRKWVDGFTGATKSGLPVLEEAALLQRTAHRNIVRVLHAATVRGRPFLVMELLEGGTVADRMVDGAIIRENALRWIHEAGAAVSAAHASRVLHRDIKPNNLLIGSDGSVRLSDFGLARGVAQGTQTSRFAGSPNYMPPEALFSGGQPPSVPSDVYSLCATAAAMFCGKHPTEPLFVDGARDRFLVTVPEDVRVVIAGGLDYDPARRPQTVRDLLAKLPRPRGAPPPPPPLTHAPRRWEIWSAGLLVQDGFVSCTADHVFPDRCVVCAEPAAGDKVPWFWNEAPEDANKALAYASVLTRIPMTVTRLLAIPFLTFGLTSNWLGRRPHRILVSFCPAHARQNRFAKWSYLVVLLAAGLTVVVPVAIVTELDFFKKLAFVVAVVVLDSVAFALWKKRIRVGIRMAGPAGVLCTVGDAFRDSLEPTLAKEFGFGRPP